VLRRHMNLDALAASILLAWPAAMLRAQAPSAGAAARTFEERYTALDELAPVQGQVANVDRLVITRDAGELSLERGQLYLLAPIGGRTIGAVFRGSGRFRFVTSDITEQPLLQRYAHAPVLETPVSAVVLLFCDSTAQQLQRLSFGSGSVPGDAADLTRDLLRSLRGTRDRSIDGDVIGPLLNADTSGFFLAYIVPAQGDRLRFEVNRGQAENVALYRAVDRHDWGTSWSLVTRFPAASQAAAETRAWQYRHRLSATRYRLDVRLTEQLSGALTLTAAAAVTLVPTEALGPWLRFNLDPRLDVDSARWGTGEQAQPFKADDDVNLWVRSPHPLTPTDTLVLNVFYHGGMIDRYGDFFYVDPGAWWYPGNAQGGGPAQFDVTYHSPARYPLVSTGDRTDSIVANAVLTTRWVSATPTYFATFNLGLFHARRVEHPDGPSVDVLLSEEAHAQLAHAYMDRGVYIPQQRNMSASVGADVTNALALFTSQVGAPPQQHFYVTEIPYAEGVSFPGFIDLSFGTFQETSLDGFDEFFRAHEVAHQWWGNGVRPATYRDVWLSEGMAEFSGLAYLQAERQHNDEYYHFLDQYRSHLLDHRDDLGPIWIGYRTATRDIPQGYSYAVYEKGAWVLHMLRLMLLDLNTLRAERFTALLADYYQTFSGTEAGTYDFAAIAERHVGAPMGWFFDQWVRRTEIPTYHVAWIPVPADNGRYRVRLRVTQEHVPADFRMPVLVAVDLGEHRIARFRVPVNGGQTEYMSPLLPSAPHDLTFNEFHSVLADVRMEHW